MNNWFDSLPDAAKWSFRQLHASMAHDMPLNVFFEPPGNIEGPSILKVDATNIVEFDAALSKVDSDLSIDLGRMPIEPITPSIETGDFGTEILDSIINCFC